MNIGNQITHFPIHKKLAILLFGIVLLFGFSFVVNAQDVIRASGGTEISVDSLETGGFVPISGPTIRETQSGQLQANETVTLTLPPGYEWNTDLTVMQTAGQGDEGTEDVTFTIEPVGAQNTDLTIEFTSLTASEFTFTITNSSQAAGAGKGPGRLTIEGLEITPTNTNVPDENTISNTGTTSPTDANYGNLSKEPGSIDEIRIETENDGSGQVVQEQDLLAGNSITVYSIARDLGGNFIENIALEEEADWSLINITGDLTQSALSPSSSLNSATFNSQSTGSAQIQADHQDGTPVPSETITVLPRSADEIQISTQPSSTATAGEAFDTQPVIELLDQFGNIVTTDNSTEITATITDGEETLLGTTTQTADEGVITFTDLYTETADTITLQFSNPDLDSVTSNEIIVEPNTPTDLTFLQQPTNTAQNGTIDPSVELQLLDDFGNEVPATDTTVTISAIDDSGNNADLLKTSSTFEVNTNNGIATFDNLNIQNNATIAEYRLQGNFDGINNPVNSNLFEVIDSGDLAKFVITATDDTNIGEQEAGQPFDIKIRAVDGDGNTFTDFNSTVTITADADISNGEGETASFTDGVLSSHSITLTSSGTTRIYAENTDVDRDGHSNEFPVTPTDVDFDSTAMSADPQEITADGSSTSEITVQLKDQYGNNLTSGEEPITLETDAGQFETSGNQTISGTTESDGTYTATLTSSTTIETASLQALNDQDNIIATTQVEFTAGDLDAFVITLPQDGGSPAIQTAGTPFDITVEAIDQNNNRVESYSGNLEFSTNSEISSGGTASISNGLLEDHSITLTQSDSTATISVEDPNIFGVDGTSNSFVVEAAGPDVSSSQVTANPVVIQNDGSSESKIIVTLRDEFGNKIFEDLSADLTISAEQIEQDGSASSGDPDANLSGLSFNSSNSTYTATLTSSTTIEDVEISVEVNGTLIPQQPIIQIVLPNSWEPSGSPEQRTDWERADNWSLGSVPTENDFVVIPGGLDDYPDLDLNIKIGSLEIQQNGQLVLFGGNSIEVLGKTQVDGTLDIEDNTSLLLNGSLTGAGTFASGESAEIEIGGDLSLANFLARTSGTVIRFNGSDQQTITSPNVLAQKLEILNDVIVTSGDLIDTSELLITEDNTFELAQDAGITLDNLKNISGDGQFILNNNTLVVRGDLSLLNIDTSEGTVVFGIRTEESFDDYPDLEQQEVANLSEMKNAFINNTEGVRTFEDIIIDGDLTLENGKLIISSGKSFIAPNQTYNNGSLQIRRSINNKGWIMMGSPINSTFSDLFDELETQGITNSDYPNKQPNLLYYLENTQCTDQDGNSTPCTDNQRWRKPADINNNIHLSNTDSTGRGYFFHVFGEVEGDDDYNTTLPKTLSISGEEYQYQTTTFDFSSITYTASADTIDSMIGWNLVSNPWAASLDWDDSGWTKNNIDDVIYIWDPSNNTYKTWNGIDGSLGDGFIKPFQAFWVKANGDSPELSVDKSVKTTDGEFYGKSKKEPASIGFTLEADTLETETHLTLTPDGSNAKDQRDAYRLLPFETETYLELYTTFDDGSELAINNLARSFGKQISIPLHVGGFKDGQPINDEYTLSWPTFGDVPDEWTIILEDQKTGDEIDLRKNTFYSFNLSQSKSKAPVNNTVENFQLVSNQQPDAKTKSQSTNSDNDSRFLIHISPGADGSDVPDEYSLGKNYPNPFSSQTTIEYNTPVEGKVEIHIYDILGRKVKTIVNERQRADYHDIDWSPTQLASGVYIVVMQAGGKQFTKKLTYIK